MAGIYLHIPFCKQACHYCDFHFSTSSQGHAEIAEAMVKELRQRKLYLGNATTVNTIYFGGGTPSLLTSSMLQKLLHTIYSNYSVANDAEITLEGNPDDLSPQKLTELRELGINRLSIGIQSFQNNHLKFLNRAHTAHQSIAVLHNANSAGFTNITIDLIYAIPHTSHILWKEDLAAAMEFKPVHISAYCLTIEPQTAFGHWVSKGKMNAIDEEYAAQQFEMLQKTLEANGYTQYEISNFCLPGHHSQHNSNYWKQKPYLGIGPSAHSYNLTNRSFNVANNIKYIKALEQGQLPLTHETLSNKDRANELLLTSLRTSWGLNLQALEALGYLFQEAQTTYIQQLVTSGQAILHNNTLTLTNTGKLLADEITARLFWD